MKRIINQRPGILILPESKLTFKPKSSIEVEEINEEIQRAITKGWVKLVSEKTDASPPNPNSDNAPAHDWEVDYSRIEENLVTISDKISGRSVTGEIHEKKGDQHYTLKDIGTVKKQQFWATTQALDQFDVTE